MRKNSEKTEKNNEKQRKPKKNKEKQGPTRKNKKKKPRGLQKMIFKMVKENNLTKSCQKTIRF